MAGIYLHIPFCKQACHYCDFHFSTNLNAKSDLLHALLKEIEWQKGYLEGEIIETIYFGGGTPSMLNQGELEMILSNLYKYFPIAHNVEITLEANPDDISITKLSEFKSLNINRLSLGIQTFNAEFLKWMHRAHNANQALEALNLCFDSGFDNLSVDLIYGLPSENHLIWENDLNIISQFPIQHISAYNLTIEPDTAFGKWKKAGKFTEASNEFSAIQMQMLIDKLTGNRYIHYEISNFALEGHFSKHNTAYWLDKKYLGIGPSAHSYNGRTRQSNIASNTKYTHFMNRDIIPFELEILADNEKANELILIGLRAIWGVNLEKIHAIQSLDKTHFEKMMAYYSKQEMILLENNHLKLTPKGRFYGDKIAADLFFE